MRENVWYVAFQQLSDFAGKLFWNISLFCRVQVGRRPEWSRLNLRGSVTWTLAEVSFVSGASLQVTFAAQFGGHNTSDEGVALDDISMKEGACTGAG